MNKKICIWLMQATIFFCGFQFFPSIAAAADDATLFKSKFKEFGKHSLFKNDCAFYTLEYSGDRDIDIVHVAFWVEDPGGEIICQGASIDDTRGDVWLKAGSSLDVCLRVDEKQMQRLLEINPVKTDLRMSFSKLIYMNDYSLEENAKLFKAKFKEIGKTRWVNGDYAFFTITYSGERDIDDISLGLRLKDANGKTLSSIAVSDQTPGHVWLKAGASKIEGVPLDDRPEAKLLMGTKPEKAILVIEVNKITFMGN
jgi:hypothetical protein